jgi:uncharacterized delta-60 repeat protein
MAAASLTTLALAGVARGVPGDLDSSFGQDGRIALDSSGNEIANGVAIQPDGKIVVVGHTSVNKDVVVYRLNSDGSLDSTFDGDGAALIDSGASEFGYDVALQPDRRIVVAGSTSAKNAAVVYRLRSNGALDRSFGDGGERTIDVGGFQQA